MEQLYQDALNKAGYEYKLKFNPEIATTKTNSRCRKRKILWFNPPYSTSVKTNVGAMFLKLVDKHFPKSNNLSKVINRKNTKVSYRTTSNIKKIISSHNKKVVRKNETPVEKKMCNCQKPPCPLQGKCLTDNLVYQAMVKCDDSEHTYVGLAPTTFKLRFGNHKKSINHERYRKETYLSDFIWELVKQGKNYKLE